MLTSNDFKKILIMNFCKCPGYCNCFQQCHKNIKNICERDTLVKNIYEYITNIVFVSTKTKTICNNEEMHNESLEMLHLFITDFFVTNFSKLDKSQLFYDGNGIIMEMSKIFDPASFFSIVTDTDDLSHPNFIINNRIKRKRINRDSDYNDYSDLVTSKYAYFEVTIGFIPTTYDEYTNFACTKQLDGSDKLIYDVIDKFNHYDFCPDTLENL